MNSRKEFTSIGFIIALTILLANDLYFKSYFNNWVTGKLSDFSGLFIFPIFWTVLFPKHKDKIYWSTALFFIYWKSALSQNFIDLINQIVPFYISRTIDFTDNVALVILPMSYLYFDNTVKKYISIHPIFIIMLSSFSFFATSYKSKIDYKKTYHFNYSLDTLKHRIYHLNYVYNYYQNEKNNFLIDSTGKYLIHQYNLDTISVSHIPVEKFVKDTMVLFVYEDFCFEGYNANISISGDSKKSKLKLTGFQHSCPENEKSLTHWNDDKKILSVSFEKKIISQLRNNDF